MHNKDKLRFIGQLLVMLFYLANMYNYSTYEHTVSSFLVVLAIQVAIGILHLISVDKSLNDNYYFRALLMIPLSAGSFAYIIHILN
jgi:hypothetical protein